MLLDSDLLHERSYEAVNSLRDPGVARALNVSTQTYVR
jgi:hypothetical protein